MRKCAGWLLAGLSGCGFLLVAASGSAQTVPPAVYSQLQYRLIGPMDGGRVLAVAGVASEPGTYYFGAANGGVWKTTTISLQGSGFGEYQRQIARRRFECGHRAGWA